MDDREFNKAVGENIRRKRIERGLSLKAVGDFVGVTYQQIQKYEVGQNGTTYRRAVQIAQAIGCDVEDFWPVNAGTHSGVAVRPDYEAVLRRLVGDGEKFRPPGIVMVKGRAKGVVVEFALFQRILAALKAQT